MKPELMDIKKNRIKIKKIHKELKKNFKGGTLPKILIYDIETSPIVSAHFGLGKQVIRHGQLLEPFNYYRILSIAYTWIHEDKVHNLVFDQKNRCCKKLIQDFAALLKEADIVLGKNNFRFDDKHISSQMLLHGITDQEKAIWETIREDLESQMRRHFYLPSYSLDYISSLVGLGGKDKMEFSDWVESYILQCPKALNKMVVYGNKDVRDTRDLILLLWPFMRFKYNLSKTNGLVCKKCGGHNLIKNGKRMQKSGLRQQFLCSGCGSVMYKALNSDTFTN